MATAVSLDDEEFVPHESFESIVRRWAVVAAGQLRDTYKLQKIYVEGGSPADYEVWTRNRKHRMWKYDKPYKKGEKRTRIGYKDFPSWGWYDENQRRRKLAQMNPGIDYWYSTGESFKNADVQVVNVSSDPDRMVVSGEIRFATTLHMIYAEAGVGRKGRENKIKIDRREPYNYKNRYAAWKPSKGDTHRPSTRQQVNYMRRRIIWLASQHFNYQINTWLQLNFKEALDTGQPIQFGPVTMEIG